jgi:hypothetical protein
MRHETLIPTIAAAVLWSTAAQAQAQVTGNWLAAACSTKAPPEMMRDCGAYLRGFLDGLDATSDRVDAASNICVPSNASGFVLAPLVVESYSKMSADMRAMPAAVSLWAVLRRAYPCPWQ